MFMGFYGNGDSKDFVTLKTYMGMKSKQIRMGFYGDGDSKAFANIENIKMKM